jgi:outer membrane protein, adhesin transport system
MMHYLPKIILITTLSTLGLLASSLEDNMTQENEPSLFIPQTPDLSFNTESTGKYYSDLQKNLEQNLSAKTTLHNAITIALENSYILKSSLEKTYQAQHTVAESETSLFPTASATIEDGVSRQYFGGSDYDAFEARILSLSLKQNLYDAGENNAKIESSNYALDESIYKYREVLEKEILKTIEAYLSVVFNSMAIQSNSENMKKLNHILDIVKIKRQNGAATIGDESSIAANVANAKATLIKIESKYSDSKSYYEFILGIAINNEHPYQSEFEMKTEDIDTIINSVEENNILLRINQSKLLAKQASLKANLATNKPTLDFSFSVSKRNSFGGGNGIEDDTRAMLRLNHLFYDAGKRESRSARILSEISALNYNDSQSRKKLMWDVKKLYNSINTLDATLVNTHDELSATYTMVDTYWETFRLSSQDLDILLQAQRQLNKTQLNILKFQQNRINDFFKLLAKEGTLIRYFGLE